MFARVFDKKTGFFYKSIIYGKLDIGYYERNIVFNPREDAFEIVDYLDKETKDQSVLLPLIEIINSDRNEWVTYDKVNVLKLNRFFKSNGINAFIKQYSGYAEIYQDFDFMHRILRDRFVPRSECSIQVREPSDTDQWTYIKTQSDADTLLNVFTGFHDSTLDKLQYVEDYSQRNLIVTFNNSGWYGIVELHFEGLISMNLRPALENYSREIFGACLFVEDECVFWADEDLDKEDLNYTGSFIKALNLKWRKID
ncbi:MAG: hypothetical protein VB111_00740 [Clostridiaceae bacterium]|nr:hypothetical protein [Clostridiaceae bacterium]